MARKTKKQVLAEKLYYCAELLNQESEMKQKAKTSEASFIGKLPDCKVSYRDPKHLAFADIEKKEKKKVRQEYLKMKIPFFLAKASVGIIILSIVIAIITGIDFMTIGTIGIVFGGVCLLIGGMRMSPYEHAKEEYEKNVKLLKEAQDWESFAVQHRKSYQDFINKANDELAEIQNKIEKEKEILDQIPKGWKNESDLEEIAQRIEWTLAESIEEAIEDIRESRKELEREKMRKIEASERTEETNPRRDWAAEIERNNQLRAERDAEHEAKRRSDLEARIAERRAYAKELKQRTEDYHRAMSVCLGCANRGKCRRKGTSNCAAYQPK